MTEPTTTTAPARRKRTPAAATTPTTTNRLMSQPESWTYVGLSRAGWFRLLSTGRGPRPVYLPGTTRPLFRQSDLDAWLAGL